jgi:hypothetical protein
VRGYDEDTNQRAREDSLNQLGQSTPRGPDALRKIPAVPKALPGSEGAPWDFNEGDLVLKLRQDNRGRHKLSPPWEGPYVVVKVLKPGTYKLANEDGEELTNVWNIQQLRRFYP